MTYRLGVRYSQKAENYALRGQWDMYHQVHITRFKRAIEAATQAVMSDDFDWACVHLESTGAELVFQCGTVQG